MGSTRFVPTGRANDGVYDTTFNELLVKFSSSLFQKISYQHSKTQVLWLGSRHNIDRLTVCEVAFLSSTVGVVGSANAGLWLRHSRQMPRAYDVEGAYERWLQNMLNRR